MSEKHYEEFDMGLIEITQKVFRDELREPFSYQIVFDPDEIPENQPHPQYIFEQLLIAFTEGLKVYFQQEQIDITQISPYDFMNVKKRFWSLGFDVDCKIEQILDESKIDEYLKNSEPDDLPPLNPKAVDKDKKEFKNVHQSNTGQSKVETTGYELKDYRFTLIKGNDRYIITFDFLKPGDVE